MLRIEDLSIDLGAFYLHRVNLTIEEGEYVALLGPTGAGKTVLLECVVGIHRPKRGRVVIDGQDVTRLYPEERVVGYVPQDYALFPNMTVVQNLAYGLRAHNRPAAEIEEKVKGMMRLLGISHLHHRLPLKLSGGDKQRVALGRALITQPRVLLLDEPLAALDENLRSDLAAELRRTQRTLGGTFLHVCHNFEEAADVADRIVLINDGRIIQTGAIKDILRHPASLFVAQFTRTRNLLTGTAQRDGTGCRVTLANGLTLASSSGPFEGPVTIAIRPEDVELATCDVPAQNATGVPGTVMSVRTKAVHTEIKLDIGVPLVAYYKRTSESLPLAAGDGLTVYIRPEVLKVFRKEHEDPCA